ncbi:cytochrome P450 [Phaeosphaeria sp. MPI-PUGE-AT-0046c]|nr:cytochrome P450 [Phaeosphaeria sp. MPI-PUGE-AT-0046c]
MLALPTYLVLSSVLLVVYLVNWRRKIAKLPPGPPRLPLIGNLHQAPSGALWLTFQKWVDQYGPLVSVDFGGTNLIIVGDFETARNLLDKRGIVYNGRPRLVMAGELVTKGMDQLFRDHGEEFFLHQRLSTPTMSPRASACYTHVQDFESKRMLQDFLVSNDFKASFERFAASIVYTLIFGLRIETGKEHQFMTSEKNLENLVKAGQVGAWIVDTLPFLNHLPAPFTPWKKTADAWFQDLTLSAKSNLDEALHREGWNWAKDFVKAKEAQEMTEIEVAWDLDIICAAGIETTNVFLQILILACITNPEVLLKTQNELDAVVGADRLPAFEDMEKLPYIRAVIEETFRWRHILPTGMPHATTQDDYYNGYLIPKNSTIIPLFIGMRNDGSVFDDPSHFRPERWLGKQQQPGNFGYGRRICTGRHIARNSIFIAVSRLLWGFNVRSKSGEKVDVCEDMFTPGFVSHPKPFEAVFEVRSEERKEVMVREWEMEDKDVGRMLDGVRERMVGVGLNPRA